jgi:hypothetical protein
MADFSLRQLMMYPWTYIWERAKGRRTLRSIWRWLLFFPWELLQTDGRVGWTERAYSILMILMKQIQVSLEVCKLSVENRTPIFPQSVFTQFLPLFLSLLPSSPPPATIGSEDSLSTERGSPRVATSVQVLFTFKSRGSEGARLEHSHQGGLLTSSGARIMAPIPLPSPLTNPISGHARNVLEEGESKAGITTCSLPPHV